jgi:1-acyl-sn-glycerol-3-phosphate acyltransferase
LAVRTAIAPPMPDHAVHLPSAATSFSHRVRPLRLFKLACLTLAFSRAAWLVWRQFPAWNPAQRQQAIQHWARSVLVLLQVEVVCKTPPGTLPTGLLVCNHLSWLDVLVLQSVVPAVFVAKSEVQSWPLVGKLAQACATLFVQRASARSARAMVEGAATSLAQGLCVVAFPEGTSSDGAQVGTFHSNIFESAILSGVPVQPLALRYLDTANGHAATAAHFTGDRTLLASLWQVTGHSTIQAHLRMAPCIGTAGHSRKSLSLLAHKAVCTQLHTLQPLAFVCKADT